MYGKTDTVTLWGVLSPLFIYFILEWILSWGLSLITAALGLEIGGMWLLTGVNAFMLPLFLWMYKREPKETARFQALDFCPVILGAVFLSRGVNALIGLTPLPVLFPGYAEVSDAIYGSSLLSQIAASGVSAPLLEETLMRGLIYRRLKLYTGNKRLAMVGSALIFGLFHGNIVQGVYAFLLGLFFAELYENYGSLVPAMAAHIAANLASILLEHFHLLESITGNLAYYYLFTAGSLLLGYIFWKWIKISSRKNRRELY